MGGGSRTATQLFPRRWRHDEPMKTRQERQKASIFARNLPERTNPNLV
jgi:hypothetical protein